MSADKTKIHTHFTNFTISLDHISISIAGGFCKKNNLSIRFVMGAWCVTAFVFVQAYTSTLFTYIVTPNFTPLLVNSVYDVINKPEINLVIVGGQNLEKVLMVMRASYNTWIFKINKLSIFLCRVQKTKQDCSRSCVIKWKLFRLHVATLHQNAIL